MGVDQAFRPMRTHGQHAISNMPINNTKTGTWSSYERYFTNLLEQMQALVNEGHEIVWGKTENWCTVNGITFNIPKDVWMERSVDGVIVDPKPISNPYLDGRAKER